MRGAVDIQVLKGEVYLDGVFLCNFLRLEYRAGRLVEQVRERGRFVRDQVMAWMRLPTTNGGSAPEATVTLHYDPWIDAYEVEIWETLEPPPNKTHDHSVLDLMGRVGQITRVRALSPALKDIKALKRLELAFRENDRDLPFGYRIGNPAWDNNFARSHQEPRKTDPSSPDNTIMDENYLIDFQRGWYFHAQDVLPVRYRNAMMEPNNPDAHPQNILEMRWLLQREFGGSVIFFHEVTIPPGKVEGTHQHIGSEELYYICEGEGIAYLRVGDDPATDRFPTENREVFGLGPKNLRRYRSNPAV